MIIKIANKLKELPHVELEKMRPLQGKLKELSPDNAFKLFELIKKEFKFPFYIWIPKKDEEVTVDGEKVSVKTGEYIVNDGTQRYTVLMANGCGKQKFPYVEIEAKNFKEYKKNLAAATSQFGKVTMEGYESFTFDFSDDEKIKFDLEPVNFNFERAPKEVKERTSMSTVDSEIYLNVKCKDEAEAKLLFEQLSKEGYECKVIV